MIYDDGAHFVPLIQRLKEPVPMNPEQAPGSRKRSVLAVSCTVTVHMRAPGERR